MMWESWALDVSHVDDMGIACFVPYDGKNLLLGMNLISDRCPGELIAAFHPDGQKALDIWIANNPDWHDRYCSKAISI